VVHSLADKSLGQPIITAIKVNIDTTKQSKRKEKQEKQSQQDSNGQPAVKEGEVVTGEVARILPGSWYSFVLRTFALGGGLFVFLRHSPFCVVFKPS
jgi:hypothetical protein